MFRTAARSVMIAATVMGVAGVVPGLVLGLAGCSSGGTEAPSCPNDYPSACPTAAPSFTNDVSPLIQANCTPCHGPGQQVPTLDTYADVMKAATMVSMQVFQCRMPPAPRAPLTSQERQTILGWLVCGTMNN